MATAYDSCGYRNDGSGRGPAEGEGSHGAQGCPWVGGVVDPGRVPSPAIELHENS
jgi:hypothetical protein